MTTWRRKTQKNQKNDAYQRIDLIKITAKLIDNITHAVQISNKDFSKILRWRIKGELKERIEKILYQTLYPLEIAHKKLISFYYFI